jgi:hypothetical protein
MKHELESDCVIGLLTPHFVLSQDSNRYNIYSFSTFMFGMIVFFSLEELVVTVITSPETRRGGDRVPH